MSAHTPGPWEWDGKFTVGIPYRDGFTYFRTNPIDAQLIAAAPDLAAALKAACRVLKDGSMGDAQAVYQNAVAVLAKAGL